MKFESWKINECLQYIHSKQLLHRSDSRNCDVDIQNNNNVMTKATGGGAFVDHFKEKFGVVLDKEDEMDCLVAGANFLLKAIRHEVFTYIEGQKEFVQIDQKNLFPYLLVNIGSGVSIIKVYADGSFERVNGTHAGGGTYCGLGMLLTDCENYKPEDISLSLLRMISYNIGHSAYLNARHYGIKRIYFGGFFIRGNAYTMNTISFAVRYWSNGAAEAMFLQHEGFLGALGAFLSYEKHAIDELVSQ
ncbi:hypothetical protein MKX01_004114 [Papaver californicum]|nr:hypothetical protein MKX01_004114 [Papaver californicum]